MGLRWNRWSESASRTTSTPSDRMVCMLRERNLGAGRPHLMLALQKILSAASVNELNGLNGLKGLFVRIRGLVLPSEGRRVKELREAPHL